MAYKDKKRQYEALQNMSINKTIRFMRKADADLIEWMEKQEHPTTEIKNVLREHIRQK